MKRVLIPFVAAFGLSLGGATGFVMFRAPKAPHGVAAPGAAHAVPTRATDKRAEPVHASAAKQEFKDGAVTSPPDQVSTPNAGAAIAATTASRAGSQSRSESASDGTPAVSPDAAVRKLGAAPGADSTVGRKLARVFGAMQPRDAARVLEQMDDSDVSTILASLSNKQQAAILGTFPTQRAATIMRAALRSGGVSQ